MPEVNARSTFINSGEKGTEKPWSTFTFIKKQNMNRVPKFVKGYLL